MISLSIRVLLLGGLGLGLVGKSTFAQNAYDRGTPAESKAGQSSLSTYAQDKIETVNLANGNLNLHIPLVTVGGRGSAGYTAALTYNSKLWAGEHQTQDLTPPGGPKNLIEHYATTYDDGNMTKPNLIPLGSGWSICKGPAVRARKIDIDPITCLNVKEGTVFKYALTKVWVVLPDGSEVEMRDDLTDGAPYRVQNPCSGTFDRSRGRVWHSTDGSAISYVTDLDNGVGVTVNDYSGWVFLADGTRLKIAAGGRCKQIIDRNGNVLNLAYIDSTVPGSVTYTDELGRQVIVQPVFDQSFDVVGATITIKGYGPVLDRTIFVDTGTIGANLRSDFQSLQQPIFNSDTDINGVHTYGPPNMHTDVFPNSDSFVNLIPISGESAVTQLRLLDGRRFQFHYNQFGELAEIIYPGGGASQIDYQAFGSTICEGGGPLNLQLNRGVTQRRTLTDGTNVDATWTYARGSGSIGAVTYPTVTVEAHQGGATGTLLMSEKHYFLAVDAEYRTCSVLKGSNGTAYEKFENARELRVERQTGNGTQVETKEWVQRASVVWSFDPSYANDPNHGQEQPPNDPRVITEDTILENGKLKRVRYGYDDVNKFNNVNSIKEYDFGQGAQGTLLRETTRTYLTSQNGYCYTNLNGVDGTCGSGVYATEKNSIHRRRLLLNETVTNSLTSAIEAYTEYEYDNYVNEGVSGNHAPIQTNSSMIQYDGSWFSPQFAAQSQPRGNATSVKRLISGAIVGGSYATEYSQYDEAGNVVKGIDPLGHATTISYADNFGDGSNPDVGAIGTNGATFAFATSATNALLQVVKTQYDYTGGVGTGVKDLNGTIAKTEYNDPYDRPTRVTAAYNLPEAAKTEMSYPTATANETRVSKQLDSIRWLAYKTTYDGFGRPLTSNEAEDGNHASMASFTILSKLIYDGLGRVKFATNPYRSTAASTDGWTRTAYDLAGRVIQVATFAADPNTQPPDYPAASGAGVTWTGSVTTSYASEITTVTDQAGKQRRSVVDGLGRLVRVDEPDSSGSLDNNANPPQPAQPTTYSYDARGNLKTVTQGAQSRAFSYDLLSRLMSASNPESGTINYTYYDNGNLKTRTDARSPAVVTTYVYDVLNRVTKRTYSDSTPEVDYYYDGQPLPSSAPSFTRGSSTGRLVAMCYGGTTASAGSYTGYDSLGRANVSVQQTDGLNYAFSYGYNLGGQMTSETYPSGRTIATSFDSAGRISDVTGQRTGEANKTYASTFSYTAHDAVASMQLGNGKWEHTAFNSRMQPTQIGLGSASSNSSLLQLDFGYGTTTNNGNVQSQTITIGVTVMSQSYGYDSLNRLATASETGAWTRTYDFDRWGNRAIRNTSYIPTPVLTPRSANSTDFSAFNQGANKIVLSGFGYDSAGNLTSDPTTSVSGIVYDAENRQTQYTKSGQATNYYYYDGDGHRVKKIDSSGTTVFVYNAGGQLIAEYHSDPVPPPAGGGGTSYLTSDHLSSTREW